MGKETRNYGIDLLRIAAMLGVVILHILSHGGILANATEGANFVSVWILNILCYPAVNCFVLIAGFVGYREEQYFPKLRNLISLVFTVLFYSVSICCVLKVFFPAQITGRVLAEAFLPITTGKYWFFTAYFAMFLVSPFLNLFVSKADRKMLGIFLPVTLLLGMADRIGVNFSLSEGYSFVWFSMLYVIGGAMKKYALPEKYSPTIWLACTGSSLGITLLVKLVFQWIPAEIFGLPLQKLGSLFISYCSPTILLAAIGALGLFARIRVNDLAGRYIRFFSAAAFSVYLIHDNDYIRQMLMADRFAPWADLHPFLLPGAILLLAAGIFLVCSLTDKLRAGIFTLLGIHKLSGWLEKQIKKAAAKLLRSFEKLF